MRRRDFLAGSACGLLGGLAGCLGPDQQPLEERPPENRVEDALQRAVGQANAAAAELATAREGTTDPTELQLDVGPLEDRVESARSELDDAETLEAADAYEDEIGAARTYVGAVGGLLAATSSFVSAGEALADLESALSGGAHGEARDHLSDLEPAVDDSRSAATTAASDLESVDRALLEPYGAQFDPLGEGLDELGGLADAAAFLLDGYDQLLQGRTSLSDGEAAYEDGDYGAAETAFGTAGDDFAGAGDAFETGAAETDTPLDGRLERGSCHAGELEAAAGHFADAAASAQSRDPAALSQYQDGEDALARAGDC